jgi:hypothetical protein
VPAGIVNVKLIFEAPLDFNGSGDDRRRQLPELSFLGAQFTLLMHAKISARCVRLGSSSASKMAARISGWARHAPPFLALPNLSANCSIVHEHVVRQVCDTIFLTGLKLTWV